MLVKLSKSNWKPLSISNNLLKKTIQQSCSLNTVVVHKARWGLNFCLTTVYLIFHSLHNYLLFFLCNFGFSHSQTACLYNLVNGSPSDVLRPIITKGINLLSWRLFLTSAPCLRKCLSTPPLPTECDNPIQKDKAPALSSLDLHGSYWEIPNSTSSSSKHHPHTAPSSPQQVCFFVGLKDEPQSQEQ